VVSADAALLELLRLLKAAGYRFTAVTPATHARVLARSCERPDLRDIFGWNRPFTPPDVDAALLACLEHSGTIERADGALRSKVRVASVDDDLFLHSAYPTAATDAVFFGPDTYRFVRFVREQLPKRAGKPQWIVDMGAGSGAGAISAGRMMPAARVTAVDLNPAALRLAAINARAAGVTIEALRASRVPERADLVIANPPYVIDQAGRAYRDGGALLGGEVALDWARQALHALAPRGAMLLYTGAAVTGGRAPLVDSLQALCASEGADLQIEESDPDVFGEELDQPAYAEVERIAVIWATIRKR
jgi:release factor glutamine methyltransferase